MNVCSCYLYDGDDDDENRARDGDFTYSYKRKRQEEHAYHSQDTDIIPLINRSPALLDGTSTKQLIPQILNLLPRALVPLQHLTQITDDFIQLPPQDSHLRGIIHCVGRLRRQRMRP